MLGVPDELVPIEIGASQRREQISRLDKAGVVDDPRNGCGVRADVTALPGVPQPARALSRHEWSSLSPWAVEPARQRCQERVVHALERRRIANDLPAESRLELVETAAVVAG